MFPFEHCIGVDGGSKEHQPYMKQNAADCRRCSCMLELRMKQIALMSLALTARLLLAETAGVAI
jgi:hypothetical protein